MSFKKTLFVSAAVAATTAGVVGLGAASAATDGSQPDKLVDRITSKVVGDKGQVIGKNHEVLAGQKEQIQQSWEARLDELVRNGKLTEDQKSKILVKHAELKAEMDAEMKTDLAGKTKEEMHARAQARHAALEAWAKANGIPEEYTLLALGLPHAKAPNMMVAPSSGVTEMGVSGHANR